MALPISILLPTCNSMKLLENHVRHLAPLLPLVEAVVHVDSRSGDGTVEYVREHVQHPHFRYFDHPPGLYPSWNFGLHQIESRYVYVSTVGDTMQADGLRRLHQVAETLAADATVSIPSFVATDRGVSPESWPIHRTIEQLHLTEPVVLPGILAFVLALRNVPESILNSSASNLYRADHLKARPFPLGFGTAGDSAWGVTHALESRIAIVPERFSTFLLHERESSWTWKELVKLRDRMLELGLATAAGLGLDSGSGSTDRELARVVQTYIDAVDGVLRFQRGLETYRFRGALQPWYFSREAWRHRSVRNRHRKAVARTFQEIMRMSRERLAMREGSLRMGHG